MNKQSLAAQQVKRIVILAAAGAVALLLSITGCSSDDNGTQPPPPACNTANTDFQGLYAATLAGNTAFVNSVTLDLLTHEYTFKVNAPKTICSVGYQGNSALFAASVPYRIEIYNATASTVVYTGNHVFNSAFTDYVSITPTALNTSDTYIIRRKVTNYLGNIGNTIGRICVFNSAAVPFPSTSGALTILASGFYSTGGPGTNFGIPYIDIVFQ